MKIKLTKKELDKMILESIEKEVSSDIEETLNDMDSEEGMDQSSGHITKGTITFDEFLTPGRFYDDSKM